MKQIQRAVSIWVKRRNLGELLLWVMNCLQSCVFPLELIMEKGGIEFCGVPEAFDDFPKAT